MLKPLLDTSPEVIKACFFAILHLEKERLFNESIRKDDDISFNRARNELYAIVDSNGYSVEWKEKHAFLKKGSSVVLSSKAH